VTAELIPEVMSVAGYLAGEEVSPVKHEYLGGQVHAMAGATNLHNTVAGNIFAILHARLAGTKCRPFNSDTKVRIELTDHVRFYYPDASIVCEPNPLLDHWQDRPVAVFEVASESTRRIDFGEKRDAYFAIPSLRIHSLVETSLPRVVVYRRKPDGGFSVENCEGLDAAVSLAEIGISLPLAAIYGDVVFESSAAK
jgi:Uma2 family endonuclease